MNRRIIEKIIEWDNQYNGNALILTGALGTGKTYLALELAKNFHDSYLYLNPRNDCKLRLALSELSSQEQPNLCDFLQTYYQIPTEWIKEFLVILDDFDYYSDLKHLISHFTDNNYDFRLLILCTTTPALTKSAKCNQYTVTPLQFDEYLKAIGSEWYTEIIQAHYQTKKKIPEIVHKEMHNLFRDYLRIGGMPAAINEYLHMESMDNISSVHRMLYENQLAQFKRYTESSSVRLNQIIELVPEQLTKENKNFRYNLIRKGATHNMYKTEVQYLCDLHLVNKIERADFKIIGEGKFTPEIHENQFRLYPTDSGILYSLIMSKNPEFQDETEEENTSNSNEKLYQLLSEAYLLQTLTSKKMNTVFWESGSLSKVDFIRVFDNCIIPVELKYYENKRSKSMHVFRQKYQINTQQRFGTQNFDVIDQSVVCPLYALFCL